MWTQEWKRKEVAYAIYVLMEQLQEKGVLEWREINKFFKLLGHQCGLVDLLPKYLPPDPELAWFRYNERSEEMAKLAADHSGVILYRRKDVMPADKFLSELLTNFSTCNSQSIVEKDVVESLGENGALDLKGFKELLDGYPNESVFFFGKKSGEYHKDDLQPFNLLKNKAGKNILDVYIECDPVDDKYNHPDGTHSRAFYIVNEYLDAKVKDMWEMLSENMDNMTKWLAKPSTINELTPLLGTRGSMVFVAANNKFLWIDRNDKAAGFDKNTWWTSNKLSYTEEAPASAAQPVSQPLSVAERRKQMLGGTATAATSTSVPASLPASVPSVTGDAEVLLDEDDIVICNYPKGDNKQRREFFYRNFDLAKNKEGRPILPNDWQNIKGLPATLLLPRSKLKERIKSMDKIGVIKDSVSKAVQDTPPTLVGPQEREAARKFLEEYGLDSPKLHTLAQMQEMFKNEPTWPEQMAIPIEICLFYPKTVRNTLVRTHPHTANLMIDTLINVILSDQGLLGQVMDELDKMREEAKSKAAEKKQARAM